MKSVQVGLRSVQFKLKVVHMGVKSEGMLPSVYTCVDLRMPGNRSYVTTVRFTIHVRISSESFTAVHFVSLRSSTRLYSKSRICRQKSFRVCRYQREQAALAGLQRAHIVVPVIILNGWIHMRILERAGGRDWVDVEHLSQNYTPMAFSLAI